MCRLVAYLGKSPLLLKALIEDPDNSLVHQSRSLRTCSGVHADGFGLAWYDREIDDQPAVFKSMQPVWNDRNVLQLVSKIRSSCFFGHIRASTVGPVSLANCHPFIHGSLTFMHNGSIRHFGDIRRRLLARMEHHSFDIIEGNTDTEHLFAAIVDHLPPHEEYSLQQLANAVLSAIALTNELQADDADPERRSRLNTVLTDGRHLVASRYISGTGVEPLTLFYARGETVADALEAPALKNNPSVIVASEPLTQAHEDLWTPVPANHLLLVDADLHITLQAIEQ